MKAVEMQCLELAPHLHMSEGTFCKVNSKLGDRREPQTPAQNRESPVMSPSAVPGAIRSLHLPPPPASRPATQGPSPHPGHLRADTAVGPARPVAAKREPRLGSSHMDGIGESTIVQLGERRGSLRTPIPDGKRKHGLGAMVLGFGPRAGPGACEGE